MKIKNVAVMSLVAVLCLSAVSCGNSETMNTDTYSAPTEAKPLSPETTLLENGDASEEETSIETSTFVTTTENSSEVTDSADLSETDNGGNNSNIGNASSNGGTGTPDLKARTVRSDLAWFRVDGKGEKDPYSLRDTNKFDEMTDNMHLNRHGDFTEIKGEAYNGYLTELFGFQGQAYWLRGEGGSKCFIETNDSNEIMAIAFTDIHNDYVTRFAEIVQWNSSENTDALGDFELTLESTDGLSAKVKPVILSSEDGKSEVWVYVGTSYSMALELVYGGGKDGGDALKTVMIYDNHRNKQ